MIKTKILNLILLLILSSLSSSASEDLISNLNIQSSATGKTLHSSSNLSINFSSPQTHLVNEVKVNNFSVKSLSYTCFEDICNYSLTTNLNSSIDEGPVTLSFMNSNKTDFAKYHIEIETDYSFTKSPNTQPEAPPEQSPPSPDTPPLSENLEEEINLKSPSSASATDLISVAKFTIENETLTLSFILKNKNDELNFIQIAGLTTASGAKTLIADTQAYEIKFDLNNLSKEILRRENHEIGFTLGVNGKRFTNQDFGINKIKYSNLEGNKIFTDKEIKITKTTKTNSYNISFKIDRDSSQDIDVKAIILNNDIAYLVSKSFTRDYVTYTSFNIEIVDYENEIKIVYEYLGEIYEFIHKFKLDENLKENDLNKLLEISSVELPFSGDFSRIGSSIALVRIKDSSDDMQAAKSIIPTVNYDLIKLDETKKEVLIAFKLNFKDENEKLNLLSNKNQNINLEDFSTSINSSLPRSRLLQGSSQIKPGQRSKIKAVKFDRKSRLVIKGKKLKTEAKLYMLDRDGNFSELGLGKINKRAKKQFIVSHSEVPESALYLIYFTTETGISFIKL